MSDRHDDDAFARNVAAHYGAPPLTGAQRSRFDARLEERARRAASRPRPWLATGAVAAAVAALLFWQIDGVAPPTDEVARVETNDAALASAPSPEDWILAMGGESLGDGDEALPADYAAISGLLLAGE